jgi:tRNA pseudouridine38-40 synthase
MDAPSDIRLKLLLAYDGRPFRGWQSQATKDAVQDFLEAAFTKLIGHRVPVIGSGRTDTGVHALAQVAHADVTRERLPLAKWAAALNAHLPPEIRVLRATHAPPRFHAQFDATGKIYTYRVWNGPALDPLEIGRVWFVPGPLDLGRLKACAQLFVGTHDFASFAANRRRPEPDTVRTIESIRITRRGPLIVLRFEGSGFLYRMVRLLTGTLVRCAQHRIEPSFIRDLLATPGRKKTHYCAPAEGLYLTRVLYQRTTERR